MFTISKRFSFDAAHFLPNVPDGHKCKRLHGHTYTVEIMLQSEWLDEHGFVIDYADLGQFKAYLDENLDHTCLNDLIPNPTAEIIAQHLYAIAVQTWHELLVSVKVSETPNTWATYRAQDGSL